MQHLMVCDYSPVDMDELIAVAERLERQSSQPRLELRRAPRVARMVCDLHLVVHHPGGTRSCYIACTRNISRGGVGALMCSFLHEKSRCQAIFENTGTTACGRVVRCRHIERNIHEIGIQFDQDIDPRPLVDPTLWSALELDKVDVGALGAATVLYVGGTELDRELFKFQLMSTGWDIRTAAAPGPVLDAVRTDHIDAIVCDLDLAQQDRHAMIERCRRTGFSGALIAITGDIAERHHELARRAGASAVMTKPVTEEILIAMIVQAVDKERSQVRGPLHSTRANDARLRPLIVQFVDQAHRLARELRAALREENVLKARDVCTTLRGSATPMGFDVIAKLAEATLVAIDAERNVRSCVEPISELIRSCEQTRSPAGA